jgi:hypothetical protein
MKKFRLFSTLVGFLVMVVLTASARAADSSAATQPTSRPAAVLQVVRWDILLRDAGDDLVKQLDNQFVQTKSQFYEATVYDAASLRGTIAEGTATGGLADSSQSLNFTQNTLARSDSQMQGFWFNGAGGRDINVGYNGNGNGSQEMIDQGNDQVSLKLNLSGIHLNVYEQNRSGDQTPPPDASILFDGTLKVGQALVFENGYVGGSGETYHHLMVWEVFKAEPWQMRYFSLIGDSLWWCQNGPEAVMKMADVAEVWAAHAAHDAAIIPDGFEKKLEDGKTIDLAGVGRMDTYPFCWWDGTGNAINRQPYPQMQRYRIESPHFASIEVHSDEAGWKLQTPLGTSEGDQRPGKYLAQDTFDIDEQGKVSVGVPVGPWKMLGETNPGDTKQVNNVEYRFRFAGQDGDDVYCRFYAQQDVTDCVTLTAVLKDGSELDPAYLDQNIDRNWGGNGAQFRNIKIEQIKTYHLWVRKRQWVTFENLPGAPIRTPDMNPSAAQVLDAIGKIEPRNSAPRVERATMATAEQRKKWSEIPADPTTPMGALRVLINAAKAGDVQGLERRMIADPSQPQSTADTMALLWADSSSLRAKAIERFGEKAIDELTAKIGVLEDTEASLMTIPWQKRPDGGLTFQGGLSVVKGPDGGFYMQYHWPAHQTSDIDRYMKTRIQMYQSLLDYLKNNPTCSLQDFQQAVQKAKIQPTTTKAG